MPNRIPPFQISNFLTHNTLPVPLSSIPSTPFADPNCPICKNSYANPPSNYVHPDIGDGQPEYATQVINRLPCSHVIGRRCLERHIRSRMPWSHTCPLCRAGWFNAPNTGRDALLREVQDGLMRLARVEVRDASVRGELEDVERALERMRDVLFASRWI